MRYPSKHEINNYCKIIATFIVFLFHNSIFGEILLDVSNKEIIKKGADLFKRNCSLCHGKKGDGKGFLAKSLPIKPRNFKEEKLKYGNTPLDIYHTIIEGRSGIMPSFKETLDKNEIEYLSIYIWNLLPVDHRSKESKNIHQKESK